MEFLYALSSHLITIYVCCKGQLGDQVVAIRRQFKKTGIKLNFFQNIKTNFGNFLPKNEKFLKFFQVQKSKILKIFFWA